MEELIEKAKNNDEKAYEEIIDEIKPILYRIARSRLDSEDDIYDAINETIFTAYQNLKKLKHNNFFQTWIIRILINKCNKIYKINRKNLKVIEKSSLTSDINNYYDDSLSSIENRIDFETLIQNLNYDERIVFVLYFYLEYNTTEISKILNINVNTIKSRLLRGKEKIAEMCKGGEKYDNRRR